MNTPGKKRLFPIQTKLVLAAGLCLLVVAGAIIGYAILSYRNTAIDAATESALGDARTTAFAIKAELELSMDAARTLGQALGSVKSDQGTVELTRADVNAMLKRVLVENPNFLGVYTLWEPNAFDGKDTEFINTEGHDASGRFVPYWARDNNGNIILSPLLDYEKEGAGDYYLCTRKTLKECLIDPYLYQVGNKMVLMASTTVPIIVDGKFYGMAGVDIPVDFLQKLADDADIYDKKGKLTIISYTGIVAGVTGQPNLVGKMVTEIQGVESDIMVDIQQGIEKTEMFTNELAVHVPIHVGNSTTPWSILITIPYQDIVKGANAMTWQMGLIAAVLIVLGLVIIWFLIGQIATKPIKIMADELSNLSVGNLNRDVSQEVKKQLVSRNDELGLMGQGMAGTESYQTEMVSLAQRIAKGDLTMQVSPRSEKDELGIAFAGMVKGLRDVVNRVATNANSLDKASEQLASASKQAGQATTQISATIQQVAKGISQQTGSVTKTAQLVEQMSHAIDGVAKGAQEQAVSVSNAANITGQINTAVQQVSGNAQAVTRDSADAATAARNGSKTVQDTIQGMQNIKSKVGLSAQKVQEMSTRSEQIGAIVEVIGDISSQTNLLALNAAIEAARAGEQGKGFAVVADEVRKLAERAANSTKEIGSLVHGIQQTVVEAVKAMDESAKEIDSGVARTNQAGDALEKILTAAENVYKQADQAANATQNIGSFVNELVSTMDAVSAVVEQNTAATEEMSASSTGVTQAIENFASVSEENSAAVEEVSASTEEMTAQVEEVSASAQILKEMAEKLKEAIAMFKL